jgi:DNA-binding MarR family transcriptional regulator/ribosomal protein S18 acetylase RimI-like enzyme
MPNDIITERGALFLGSRMKRLAERMQADVSRISAEAGLPIQSSQYPLLATLDRAGAMTVSALAETLGLSQPAITRTLANLVTLGLVDSARAPGDQRQKRVSLTAAGTVALARARIEVWPRVEAAVVELLAGLDGPLLDQIGAIETRLTARPLHATPGLKLHEFSDALAQHFHDINVEWIEALFVLEPTDREVLLDPRGRIIEPGGTILFVEAAGLGIVGTCALQKTGAGAFELTKMGVREAARGRKAGEYLLAATIARAEAMEVEKLYLLTSKRCAAAIHLYEKLGFKHDAEIMRDYGARYARCDVAMRYRAG